MKTFILFIGLTILHVNAAVVFGQNTKNSIRWAESFERPDSVKLKVEGDHAYYQKVVKADSVAESTIYQRAVQFMAAKNFQQNYGYQQEGKLIFTTSQDLNINPVYAGDEDDIVDPYNVQFSVTLDLKNRRYRYTIGNVVFFFPTDNGNKRETLYDIYLKASGNGESRHNQKIYKSIIESFESYISTLVTGLREAIQHKLIMYNSKF